MTTTTARPLGGRLGVVALGAAAWLGVFVVTNQVVKQTDGGLGGLANTVIYLLPHVAAILLAVRAARRTEGANRRLWVLLAFSLPLWLGGELVYAFYLLALGHAPSFPGAPDALFLGFYLALIVAFVVALRPALKIRSWKAILDSSVLTVTIVYVGWITVVQPQLIPPISVRAVVGAAYPVLGIAMVTILLSFVLATYRRPPVSLALLIGAIFLGSCNDLTLTYASLHSSHPVQDWNRIGWEAETLLIALAAYAAGQHRQRVLPVSVARHDRGIVIALLGAVAMLVAALIELMRGPFTIEIGILALYVGGAIALRLYLTTREREDLTSALEHSRDEQQRLADTDELTGLRNRRYADRRLHQRTIDALPAEEIGVLILDLDHFKDVNDTHGHPAGDAVLGSVSKRLVDACRAGDIVARYGGEEFLVVVHQLQRERLPEIAERFRAAVAEDPIDIGTDMPIIVTVSVGGASMPADAATLTELMRIADRALYTAKGNGRNRVQIGAHADEGSIEALMERGTVLNFVQSLVDHIDEGYDAGEHGRETARLTGLTADELDLPADVRARATAGARLHDIGKICIPPEVLRHPGPLNEREWKLIHRHPEAGAQMLALAPGLTDLADGVRQHHERYDGGGYPAGLSDEDICIEARVIAVCDAWSAMTTNRPYRAALTTGAALAELRRHEGSQFDPHVVGAFAAVYARRLASDQRPLAHQH